VERVRGNDGSNIQALFEGEARGLGGADSAHTSQLAENISQFGLDWLINNSSRAHNLTSSEMETLRAFANDIEQGNDTGNNSATDNVSLLVDENGLIAKVADNSAIDSQIEGNADADTSLEFHRSVGIGGDLYGVTEEFNVKSTATFTTREERQERQQGHQDPIVLDTDGDGIETTENMVQYDIDGDGSRERVNNVDDGILAIDGGDDGSELFGNNTDLGMGRDYANGFEALRALAEREGLIGPNDQVLNEQDIKHLEDKYGFGIKTDGYNSEVQSLLSEGITQISLGQAGETEWNTNFDGRGNALQTQEGATFRTEDGEINNYADVWHRSQ